MVYTEGRGKRGLEKEVQALLELRERVRLVSLQLVSLYPNIPTLH